MARRFIRPVSRRAFTDGSPSSMNAGRSYQAIEREATSDEHENRIAHYQQMAQQLAAAKEARLEAEHRAQFEKQMKYEAMMTAAIKKIGHINPAAPDAGEKWNQIFQEHPELFHTEKGLPSLTPYYEQFQRLSATAQAAREKQQAAAEAQKAHQEEINQRRQENEALRRDLQSERLDAESRRTKERTEDKRDAALGIARNKYETITEKAKDAKDEMEATQAEIDRLKGKPKLSDEDKYHLDRMVVSLNKWKQKMVENQALAKGLEKQFPELSPDYVPKDETKSPGTTEGGAPDAIDTAQPDVPAIRQTAPVSGGTATPSGDMVPLGTEAPATAATPAPAGAPAATATPTTAAAAAPAPGDINTQWDALTNQLHEATKNADAARAKRDAAMDVLTKAGYKDFLGGKIGDAQKQVDAANAEIDQHDATYKDIFDKRGALLKQQSAGIPAAAPAAPAPATSVEPPPAMSDQTAKDLFGAEGAVAAAPPHPYEGKRVRQKSTGQFGTFVNGQFVPEEQEAMQDQPTPEIAAAE